MLHLQPHPTPLALSCLIVIIALLSYGKVFVAIAQYETYILPLKNLTFMSLNFAVMS